MVLTLVHMEGHTIAEAAGTLLALERSQGTKYVPIGCSKLRKRTRGRGMEKKTKQIERIEKALAQAHREQTAPDLPPEWCEGAMCQIRRIRVEGDEQDAVSLDDTGIPEDDFPLCHGNRTRSRGPSGLPAHNVPGNGTRPVRHARTRSIRFVTEAWGLQR